MVLLYLLVLQAAKLETKPLNSVPVVRRESRHIFYDFKSVLLLTRTGDVSLLSLHRDTTSPPLRCLISSSSENMGSFSNLPRIISRRLVRLSLSFSSSSSSAVMPRTMRFSSKSTSSSLRFWAAFLICTQWK